MSSNFLSSTFKSFVVGIDFISVPKSLLDTTIHNGWRQVMEEKMNALEHNDTCNLVSLPVQASKLLDANEYILSR